MVRITFKAGDDYTVRLLKLANTSDEMMKKAVYAGTAVVADKIRANLEANLAGSSQSTGALSASLGITPISQDKDGFWNAKIGFDGYDEKGVPNQLKARVMESGSSKVKKRPFVRPAVNAARQASVEAMKQSIEKDIEETMGG